MGPRARAARRQGRRAFERGPSFPVEILGFSGTPEAGDRVPCRNEARAREVTEYRERQKRENSPCAALGALLALRHDEPAQDRRPQEFPLVVKGDVQGSVEAILAALESSTPTSAARVVHAGVGGIRSPTSRWRRLPARR